MKRSEIIAKYRKEIAAEMVQHYRTVLECSGRIQYKVYVWEDGELECLEGVQGDTSYLRPRDAEPRELYFVCTLSAACFDPWDFADHSAPEDESEREKEEAEIIDYLVDEYETGVFDVLDAVIEEAEQEEQYDY